jgi:hypothetical protein
MLTNILLGLILITLIIIICGRQEKHTITMFIQDNEKALIPNTIEVVDLRDPVSKLPDCREEGVQDCLPKETEHNQIVEESYHAKTTVELPTEIKVAKKTGPKPRLRTEEEMQFIVSSILSDKKERGNTSATLFRKYKITKATFYKYATEEQAKELMEMQTALRKKRNFGRGRK